jgi:hypothetical protein
LLPNPPPAWIQYLPNGKPHPNIVVEVAVGNESPQEILDIMQRYFSATTSVQIWIGVKVWLAGHKFWVAWAHRNANGVGGTLVSLMQFPPNHASLSAPVNVTYLIPTSMIYGANVNLPPNFNVDHIRHKILDALS